MPEFVWLSKSHDRQPLGRFIVPSAGHRPDRQRFVVRSDFFQSAHSLGFYELAGDDPIAFRGGAKVDEAPVASGPIDTACHDERTKRVTSGSALPRLLIACCRRLVSFQQQPYQLTKRAKGLSRIHFSIFASVYRHGQSTTAG
jgi:hypothetical protein